MGSRNWTGICATVAAATIALSTRSILGQTTTINTTLLNTANNGHVLSNTSTNFKVNYPAVLAWLKTGPKTMPPNLRAGRILFYTQIPNDCTSPARTIPEYPSGVAQE